MSALLTGSWIDVAGFEIGPDGGHEVVGVAAAEAAVDALALLQFGVGHLHHADWSRLGTIAAEAAEGDQDRRASGVRDAPFIPIRR